MDNTREDKPTTNAAAEEILSEEELDSVAGGGTGCGSYSFVSRFGLGGGTGRG